MTESQKLLADYARNGSEAAFRELVTRYVDFVHSTALRLVNGDAHLAEDVTQTVFLDLARRAPALSSGVMPGGWLHRHTCFVASKTMRTERRRQARERRAAEMNAQQDNSEANLAQLSPLLDDAINALGAQDRTAILLRFFEQRDFRSVGEELGSNEEAARKRVGRALEKLHALLQRRGVTLSLASLGTALGTAAVQAAPAGLAAGIAGMAIAGAAGGGGITLTLLNLMSITKLKLGIIGAVLIGGAVIPFVAQHQAQARLRDENQSLRQNVEQLTAENERIAKLLALAQAKAAGEIDQASELLRLRGEVGRLREAARAAERQKPSTSFLAASANPTEHAKSLAGRVQALKQKLEQMPELNIPELQFASERDWLEAAAVVTAGGDADLRRALGGLRTLAKNKVGFLLMNALQAYTQANGRELPTDLAQLKPYLQRPVDDAILQRYQITTTGNLKDFKLGQHVIKEKAYVDEQYDTLNEIGPNTFSLRAPKGEIGVPRQLAFGFIADDDALVGPAAEKKLEQILNQ